jgi:ABC-2 type transport system ATP-binding protein
LVLAIRCCGLTKRYRGRAAVDGLDLEVQEGELFGFLGANGAGKTTTIRMLLGLVRPDAGEAWVLGSPVPCPARLPDIGAMVEEPAFYPWLSGRANLEIVGDEGGPLPRGAIEETLALAGLTPAADIKVKTYSQGMRQRLGLAVALLRRPRLVLLDEPANGMDPAGIHVLRNLLRHMGESGTTVLLSSHLLGEVEQVCQQAAIIDGGRLISVGPVDRLGTSGEQIRVALDPGEVAGARTALASCGVTSDGPGQLLVSGAGGRQVNQLLAMAGVFAAAISVERPSLEARFLAITGGGHPDAPGAR